MTYTPGRRHERHVVVSGWHVWGFAPKIQNDFPAGAVAWPTANKALYHPIEIPSPVTIYKFWSLNGTGASGNIDIGIYDETGTRLLSTGSTAFSASVLQQIDVTDTVISPGRYFLAMAASSTVPTVYRAVLGSAQQYYPLLGVFEQTSAFALPSSATFAEISQTYAPYFGALLRTTDL